MSAFSIDPTGAELLCSEEMIRDLLEEVEEFPESVLDDGDKIAEQIVLAKSYLEAQTGKRIAWKEVANELHDGNEKPFLFVRRPPILSVSKVLRVEEGAGTTLTAGMDYWVYNDNLQFLVPTVRGHQNYQISYRSGIAQSVGLHTAQTIALVVARHIAIELGSGANLSEAISAGPVALRESFGPGGKYASKLARWSADIQKWVNAKHGIRAEAVGKQLNRRDYGGRYSPRLDRWI